VPGGRGRDFKTVTFIANNPTALTILRWPRLSAVDLYRIALVAIWSYRQGPAKGAGGSDID
jgi:hypothetical protein